MANSLFLESRRGLHSRFSFRSAGRGATCSGYHCLLDRYCFVAWLCRFGLSTDREKVCGRHLGHSVGMKPIIKVEDLSKEYQIGTVRPPYQTLRETLSSAVRIPLRRFQGRSAPRTETIWALKRVSFA